MAIRILSNCGLVDFVEPFGYCEVLVENADQGDRSAVVVRTNTLENFTKFENEISKL